MKDWHKVKDLHTTTARELAQRYGCSLRAVYAARFDSRRRQAAAARAAAPKVAEASHHPQNVTVHFKNDQRNRIADMATARGVPSATLVRQAALIGLDALAANPPPAKVNPPPAKVNPPLPVAKPQPVPPKKTPAPDMFMFRDVSDKVERAAAQVESATDVKCGMTPNAQAKALVAKMVAKGSTAADIARALAGRGFTNRMVASILNRAGFRARGESLHNHATVLDLIFPAA